MSEDQGKLCAILSYLLVGIIWYVADEKMRKDSFAKYHVKQAIVLLIVGLIVGVINNAIRTIPFIGWTIASLVGIIMLILWIVGLVYAATDVRKPLPIIGAFAAKLKI